MRPTCWRSWSPSSRQMPSRWSSSKMRWNTNWTRPAPTRQRVRRQTWRFYPGGLNVKCIMLFIYFPFQAKEEIELKKDCLQVQCEGEEEARRWERCGRGLLPPGEREKGGRRLRLDSADARWDSCADATVTYLQYLYSLFVRWCFKWKVSRTSLRTEDEINRIIFYEYY